MIGSFTSSTLCCHQYCESPYSKPACAIRRHSRSESLMTCCAITLLIRLCTTSAVHRPCRYRYIGIPTACRSAVSSPLALGLKRRCWLWPTNSKRRTHGRRTGRPFPRRESQACHLVTNVASLPKGQWRRFARSESHSPTSSVLTLHRLAGGSPEPRPSGGV